MQAVANQHFEVQVLTGGRWLIECTSRDRRTSLIDAQELMRRPDVRAVKVIKETTSRYNGRTAAAVIHQAAKPEAPKSEASRSDRWSQPSRVTVLDETMAHDLADRAGTIPASRTRNSETTLRSWPLDVAAWTTMAFMLLAAAIYIVGIVQGVNAGGAP